MAIEADREIIQLLMALNELHSDEGDADEAAKMVMRLVAERKRQAERLNKKEDTP